MELSKNVVRVEATAHLILRAFRHRNYRLYFAGQSLSLTGSSMQQMAMSWLVYRLTGSVLLLGIVGFAGQIPSFLLTPVAGVLADRWNRRKLMISAQIVAMLQAVVLAVLTLTGAIEIWHIVALSSFLGIVNAFDIPVRHSLVVDMVDDREDLGNAIALNSSMFHGARLVGPAVAGFLISAFGEGVCFLLNGVSFLAVIVALAAMRIKQRQLMSAGSPILRDLSEGVNYAFSYPAMRSVLFLIGLISLVGMPYLVLMPAFAKDILHGGPQTLGLLLTASGVGAFAGTVFLASRRNANGLGRVIYLSAFLFAASMAAFALSRTLWMSLPSLFFAGFSIVTQVASGNTIIQTIVEEDKRGRLMSLFNMSFMGMAPFGSLLAGAMAREIGVPYTLILCALFCLAGSLVFAGKLRRQKEYTFPPER
ncbi:MAG: MFS transporter [Deltaproteobacteria bacterium]